MAQVKAGHAVCRAGIIFIIPICAVTLILGARSLFSGDYRLLYAMLFILICGAIGFIDDFTKFTHKQNKGLNVRQKTIMLAGAITLYVAAMYFSAMSQPMCIFRFSMSACTFRIFILF